MPSIYQPRHLLTHLFHTAIATLQDTFRPRANKPSATHKKTIEPIEPPWQAVKEWIPDDEPDLDWFNRPRNPANPDPHGFDQRPRWAPQEVPLDDERILVVDTEPPPPDEFA